MFEARPYNDHDAMAVFRQLDAMDMIECEIVRGSAATSLGLFADWRAMQPHRPLSYVAIRGGVPFAVFALSNTGQAGVAQAALLSRDHARYRRALAELCAAIRAHMPKLATEAGIHRIEARSWANHPTGGQLLLALGFAHECAMPGFGLTGTAQFSQYAWTAAAVNLPLANPKRS